jgi:dipeptidyl aminopeptidase/acylaminoacyl peptidase
MGRVIAWVSLSFFLIGMASDTAFARIPLETFAAPPWIGQPQISPNGLTIAAPLWGKEGETIAVYDVDAPSGTKIKGLTIISDADVDWIRWANDRRLLIAMKRRGAVRYGGKKYDASVSYIVAIDRDGSNRQELFANRVRFPGNFDLSEVVHDLPDDPDAVLMDAWDASGRNNLYRVNVYSGKADQVMRGEYTTYRWLTDPNGIPRARWDYHFGNRIKVYLRQGDSDDWEKVAQYGERDFPTLNIVGFADDPRIAIVASRQSSDLYGLYEFDTATKKLGKPIFQHPSVDVGEPEGGPLYDPSSKRLVGAFFVDDQLRRHYFDPELAATQRKIDAAFADAAVIKTSSWSRDGSRMIVYTSGPRHPGSYHVFDGKTGKATLIAHARRNMPPEELAEMRPFKYKARDGTEIPAYLIQPRGQSARKSPMVVLPHGGPEVRDFISYDQWAQMLANRGYTVFQPNFRGSGGYGKAFAEAGYRQWGRRMQDDITDGVRVLIANGTADADRICIAGASYGGYAALAGGAFTPELYRCVVAIAAVTDLPEFLETRADQVGEDSAVYDYWVRLLGDRRTDREQMNAVSPALHAPNFRAPVLLIHGDADENVPIEQSVRMDKALRAAGKKVEFVIVEKEGHNFSKRSSDLKVMSELEKFIAANIGE